MVGDQPAERVVGQPRHPGRRAAQPGQADGGVQLRAADLHVEAAGLLQPAKVRRAQADHRFAEGDDVVRHGRFLEGQKSEVGGQRSEVGSQFSLSAIYESGVKMGLFTISDSDL